MSSIIGNHLFSFGWLRMLWRIARPILFQGRYGFKVSLQLDFEEALHMHMHAPREQNGEVGAG